MSEIIVNKQIQDKAYKITMEKAIEREYLRVCKEAGICPTCGEPTKDIGTDMHHIVCTKDEKHQVN